MRRSSSKLSSSWWKKRTYGSSPPRPLAWPPPLPPYASRAAGDVGVVDVGQHQPRKPPHSLLRSRTTRHGTIASHLFVDLDPFCDISCTLVPVEHQSRIVLRTRSLYPTRRYYCLPSCYVYPLHTCTPIVMLLHIWTLRTIMGRDGCAYTRSAVAGEWGWC